NVNDIQLGPAIPVTIPHGKFSFSKRLPCSICNSTNISISSRERDAFSYPSTDKPTLANTSEKLFPSISVNCNFSSLLTLPIIASLPPQPLLKREPSSSVKIATSNELFG